jgi:hypothetical protein
MPPNDLLTFTRKRPFEPFRLVVTDGTTYDIHHPEFCMVLQTSVIVGLPGTVPPDRVEWIDARHIVKVIPLGQPAGGAQANGPQG